MLCMSKGSLQCAQHGQQFEYLGSKAKSRVKSKDKCREHRVTMAIESGEKNVFEQSSLERILSRQNMKLVYKKVVANKGN